MQGGFHARRICFDGGGCPAISSGVAIDPVRESFGRTHARVRQWRGRATGAATPQEKSTATKACVMRGSLRRKLKGPVPLRGPALEYSILLQQKRIRLFGLSVSRLPSQPTRHQGEPRRQAREQRCSHLPDRHCLYNLATWERLCRSFGKSYSFDEQPNAIYALMQECQSSSDTSEPILVKRR